MKSWKQNLFTVFIVGAALAVSVAGFVRDRSRDKTAQDRLSESQESLRLSIRELGEQRRHYVVVQAQQQLEILALLDAQDTNSARQRLTAMLKDSEEELYRHSTDRETDGEKEQIAETKQKIGEYFRQSRRSVEP